MQKLRVGDKVKVTRGSHSGKEGEITKLIKNKQTKTLERVHVSGIQTKRNVKPNPLLNTAGGIVEIPVSIHASNVMLLDTESKGAVTRVGVKDGSRVAKKSGKEIK